MILQSECRVRSLISLSSPIDGYAPYLSQSIPDFVYRRDRVTGKGGGTCKICCIHERFTICNVDHDNPALFSSPTNFVHFHNQLMSFSDHLVPPHSIFMLMKMLFLLHHFSGSPPSVQRPPKEVRKSGRYRGVVAVGRCLLRGYHCN